MDNQEIITEFLSESHENLDQLDRDLVTLESDPTNADGLARIFRTIHTIKGTCGFLGFTRLEAVTHAGEGLLSRLRDGRLVLQPAITTALLALVDTIREILAGIAAAGQEGEGDDTALVAALTRLQEGGSSSPTEPAPAPPAPVADERQADTLAGAAAESVAESTVRVDVGLLDKLMNLVGELVLARNQILQLGAAHPEPALAGPSQRLNLITTELQERVMKTRLQPIHKIWKKFPRVIRDLALACGKQVRLVMEGKETELDRTIIEALKDPLTHLVRNAVDHGIEPPAVRQAGGKPAAGLLFLRAFHEGGQVNIEISDDGAGIDPERVRRKARERGLLPPEQLAALDERQLLQLVFVPGFSTAEEVTSLSGRGVGMDVVKTNIEKVGGTVDLQSRPGEGTRVKIKIPLTLAIIPALVVTSGDDRYAIPQVNLLELVRLEGERPRRGIEKIHDVPFYRLRGQLLPLVYLDRELQTPAAQARPNDGPVNIVVLQAADRQFGLVVERINDTEEIVVKPLGRLLREIPLFAGATIMGDGKVALILDVLGVAQRAAVVAAVRQRTPAEPAPAEVPAADAGRQFLLVALGPAHRLAIPLSQVTRLEEIGEADVERTADAEVMQYRGGILPLVRLGTVFHLDQPAASGSRLPVVVCGGRGRSVGLVVDRILDTVDATVSVTSGPRRPGILGSAVIRQRVTDLLDVASLMPSDDEVHASEPVSS